MSEPPEAKPATLQRLLKRAERLAETLKWKKRGEDLGPDILDAEVRLMADSVRQYQRERAVDKN